MAERIRWMYMGISGRASERWTEALARMSAIVELGSIVFRSNGLGVQEGRKRVREVYVTMVREMVGVKHFGCLTCNCSKFRSGTGNVSGGTIDRANGSSLAQIFWFLV